MAVNDNKSFNEDLFLIDPKCHIAPSREHTFTCGGESVTTIGPYSEQEREENILLIITTITMFTVNKAEARLDE